MNMQTNRQARHNVWRLCGSLWHFRAFAKAGNTTLNKVSRPPRVTTKNETRGEAIINNLMYNVFNHSRTRPEKNQKQSAAVGEYARLKLVVECLLLHL